MIEEQRVINELDESCKRILIDLVDDHNTADTMYILSKAIAVHLSFMMTRGLVEKKLVDKVCEGIKADTLMFYDSSKEFAYEDDEGITV